MNVKKHINFTGMRKDFSGLLLDTDKDHRLPGKIDYSVNDAVMSGFACMYFQDTSIKAFQKRLQDEKEMNNLTTMFGVKSIPGDSQLRNIVDALCSEIFRPVFKDVFMRLQRGKQLEQFQVFPNTYLAALDGSQYFYSEKIKCGRCRWKIENECSNTLKNQGYDLEHSYGHGERNLCFNFLLLTLISFLFHQVLELTDKLYQAVREKMGSKRKMWETLRSYIQILIFNSWEHLLDFTLAPLKYNPVFTNAP